MSENNPRKFTYFNCKTEKMVIEGHRNDGKCHNCKEVIHLVEVLPGRTEEKMTDLDFERMTSPWYEDRDFPEIKSGNDHIVAVVENRKQRDYLIHTHNANLEALEEKIKSVKSLEYKAESSDQHLKKFEELLAVMANDFGWDNSNCYDYAELVSLVRGGIMNDREKTTTLFEKIKHGDEAHQAWLKSAIEEHFK